MSIKKKRLLTIVGLLLLVVAMGVLYAVVPKGKDSQSSEDATSEATDAPTLTVESIEKETVTKLSMKTESEEVTLVKNSDTWNFDNDDKSPVNTEMVSTMLNSLAPVTAQKELSLEENSLGDYGLDKPTLVITVTTSDKKSYTYSLGSEVPVVGGYYGQGSDSTKLYAFSSALYSAFNQTKDALIQMETAPEITADYITYLNVDNKSGDDFETEQVSEDKRVDSTSKWNITKPYRVPLAANVSTFNTLLDTYTSYAFSSCVGFGIKDLSKYGLDNPTCKITMKYYTAKTSAQATATPQATADSTSSSEIAEKDREYHNFSLLIGKKTKSGYYVKMGDSDAVYIIAADAVKTYMKPDVYTYVDHCIYTNLATKINGFDVYVGGKVIKATRKSTGEKKDGVEQNDWYVNGTKVDLSGDNAEETFLTPYSKAYLLEISGEIKSSVKPKSDKSVLKIVYHEKNKDVTVRYLPYDNENFYRVEKNGVLQFLTDKRAVDDAADAFAGMLDMIK